MNIESIISSMGEETLNKIISKRLKDNGIKSLVVYFDKKENIKFYNSNVNILEYMNDLQKENTSLKILLELKKINVSE